MGLGIPSKILWGQKMPPFFIMWFYKQNNMISGRGIGLQGFSSRRVHSLVVPLPPLAEQKRIVATIEKLLPLCEKLGE